MSNSLTLNFGNLGRLWEDLCNLIIRPQRAQYDAQTSLGPKLFTLQNKIFERKDFTITNTRGLKLVCSHFQPVESQRPCAKVLQLPCVIYCHGNCGCRCDALDAVQILLPYHITVFCFDFSGSGLSEGDYVSLGFYERQDLAAVCDYLWSTNRVSRIGLWGRSMGAATSIQYSSMDHTIAGVVADSPFTSLEDVMTELVLSYQNWIPRKIIKLGISIMKKSIQSRANFDIRKNCPIEYAKNAFAPILFAHATGDDFIKIHHSEKLYEAYSGDKNIIRFEGDHNSERPDFVYDSIAIFFYNTLIANDPNLDESAQLPQGSISQQTGVGKETEKGKEIAELENDSYYKQQHQQQAHKSKSNPSSSSSKSPSSSAPSTTSPSSAGPVSTNQEKDSKSSIVAAESESDLSTYLHAHPTTNTQVVLPSSLVSPKVNMQENEQQQQARHSSHQHVDDSMDAELLQVMILSVREELERCTEDEKSNLLDKLDELTEQAKALSL